MRNKHPHLYYIDDETKKRILDFVSGKDINLTILIHDNFSMWLDMKKM